jgi:hypothetical protein
MDITTKKFHAPRVSLWTPLMRQNFGLEGSF